MKQFILSYLVFPDLLNFRLVSKQSMEMVDALPKFKLMNCLCLDHCTISTDKPPITCFSKTNLKFLNLKVGEQITLEQSLTLQRLISKFGETVTYLDLSNVFVDTDVLSVFIENISLFKVLHHLKIYSASKWICFAYLKPLPTVKQLTDFLSYKLIREAEYKSVTVDQLTTDNFFMCTFYKRQYKEVIIEVMTEHCEILNQPLNVKMKLIEILAGKITEKLIKMNQVRNFSKLMNLNVRKLTLHTTVGLNLSTFKQMLNLFPNIQEIEDIEKVVSASPTQILVGTI